MCSTSDSVSAGCSLCKTQPVPSTSSVASGWQPEIPLSPNSTLQRFPAPQRGIKYYLTYINTHSRLSNLTLFLIFLFPRSFSFCCITCVLIKSLKIHLQFYHPRFEICVNRLRSISCAENNFSYKNYRVSTTQFGKPILYFNVSRCFPLPLRICSNVGHKAEVRPDSVIYNWSSYFPQFKNTTIYQLFSHPYK